MRCKRKEEGTGVAVQVVTPTEYIGDVIGGLQQRRLHIKEIESRSETVQIVSANAPLAEMFGYATSLRSATQGRANYSMEFSHYAQAPESILDKIKKG